ncbi:MAG: hypothetical protein R2712_26320 [Vicinamibacterales bacterium]
MTTPRFDLRSWLRWPALAAALVALNASLTFANVWPTPKIRWDNALSVELAAVVLLLAVAHRHARRLARVALPAVWVILVAGHYLDVTAPGLYGRDFNLYWDSQHLGNVTAMLARDVPLWLIATAATALFTVLAVVWFGARVALGQVAAAVADRRARVVLGTSALLLVVAFAAAPAAGLPFSAPVTHAYARQARFVLAMAGPGQAAPALGTSPDLDAPIDGLHGADVLVIFVEAYGAVTYDNPAFADALAPSRDALAGAAREAGRSVVSAFVESPTFGASSWLAHLTLLTGVEVRDQYAYVALMASGRDTLPRAFRRHGYRSVALMPGMRQAWPEGAFYGFNEIYGREGLTYAGPSFGWWSIPDQFALARLDALELARAHRTPRFVVFPTSTTHAPFGPVAPYVDDWSTVLTPSAFDPGEVSRAMALTPDLTNLAPAYLRAMSYEFRTFAGYVREHAGDPMVVVLVGDHQPVAAVSGPGASHEVPVHVIASPGPVVDRLVAAGFRPGMGPQHPPVSPLHGLVPTLLHAFAADSGDDGAAAADDGAGAADVARASRQPQTHRR